MKTIYQACDGTLHETSSGAFDHEAEVFESWLSTLLAGTLQVDLSDVVCHFNASPGDLDEFYGTPSDLLKTLLKTYWDTL